MMKGVAYARWGKPEDVCELRADLPAARIEDADDVLVAVHAASINPADYKQMGGSMRALMSRPFPIRPGFDLSGVVLEVGSNVTGFKPGDEVCAMVRGLRTGSTCERIAVNQEVLCKKPPQLSHAQAAAIPLAAITAAQCLERGGLKPVAPGSGAAGGKSVLVTAGAGGVGTFAIQLAKKVYGAARVVTTASFPDKAELCRSLGADHVVDYRAAKFWEELKGERFDVCVDMSDEAAHMVALTKPGGVVVSITASPTKAILERWVANMGPVPGIELYTVPRLAILNLPAFVIDAATGARGLRRNGVDFDHIITIPSARALEPILALAASGDLRVVIDKVFPFDEAVQAYVRSASGRATGKVVVQVVPP